MEERVNRLDQLRDLNSKEYEQVDKGQPLNQSGHGIPKEISAADSYGRCELDGLIDNG